MINYFINLLKEYISKIFSYENENLKLMLGRILSNQLMILKIHNIAQAEYRIFSQFGDDGIIQFLIQNLNIENKIFIEFGVEDYSESNTRFLLQNNNWSGLVMDGSLTNINKIKSQYYFWRHDLNTKAVFINKDNINQLIKEQGYPEEIGLLHIDLDGNDYYIWRAITCIKPTIVIVEYNSIFGITRPISVIYNKDFIRNKAHYSNLFWGASLLSLNNLAISKGYSLIGCNTAGNNAYFIRNDKLNDIVKKVDIDIGYVKSKYRESRDAYGNLSYLNKTDSENILKGLNVFNTNTNQNEIF